MTLATAALLAAGFSVQAGARRPVPVEVLRTWTPNTDWEPDEDGPRHAALPARFCPRPPSRRVEAMILEAGLLHGVSPALVRAVVEVESGFDPLAVSPVGALGLMQLTPTTARRLGVTDCFDVRQNLLAGTRHLRELLDLYEGDVALAAAAYNAGRTAVARHGGVPPYPETRDYVRRVTTLALAPRVEPGSALAEAVAPLEPAHAAEEAAPSADAAPAATSIVASAVPVQEAPPPAE